MNPEDLTALPVHELLERTQTNVTSDPVEGLAVAGFAYERASTPIEKGGAARQACFRAEQAGEAAEVVEAWFVKSRAALSSDEPEIKRELIATELLMGRSLALRIERLGSTTVALAALASDAFERGEAILQEQHVKGKAWDRFGTMLARHHATHEAMNGSARFAALTAIQGLWRAIRAEKEGTPENHIPFVVKQLGMNAITGTLAISKPFARINKVSAMRQQLALKLLG